MGERIFYRSFFIYTEAINLVKANILLDEITEPWDKKDGTYRDQSKEGDYIF